MENIYSDVVSLVGKLDKLKTAVVGLNEAYEKQAKDTEEHIKKLYAKISTLKESIADKDSRITRLTNWVWEHVSQDTETEQWVEFVKALLHSGFSKSEVGALVLSEEIDEETFKGITDVLESEEE